MKLNRSIQERNVKRENSTRITMGSRRITGGNNSKSEQQFSLKTDIEPVVRLDKSGH